MEEESGDGSVEQEVQTPPPSVVVGAFASPGGQVAPLLNGQVAAPGVTGGIAATSPYGVVVGAQPKLSFSDWFKQLHSTTNGRFKIMLAATIIALMTVVPIFMEIAYDESNYNEMYEAKLDQPVTIEGQQMKVTQFPDSPEIETIHWLEVSIGDGYCWDDEELDSEPTVQSADGEMWYKISCERWNNGWRGTQHLIEEDAWVRIDSDGNMLFAHQSKYGEVLNMEVESGLLIIADFIPVVGCLLIPISIIGIFVTRHEKSPAQLVH